MFINLNLNPDGLTVGDCSVRAISYTLNQAWEKTYSDLCILGAQMSDMPSANRVWQSYLNAKSLHRKIIPDTCPACYTVKNFCKDHPSGKFILGTGTHVVAIDNGDYIDTWDSGFETVIYYWEKNV